MNRHGLVAVMSILLLLFLPSTGAQGHAQESQTRPHEDGHGHDHDATASHPFDDPERWERVFDDPDRAEWQKPDEIPVILGLKAGMVVADVGAGTGYFERFLSEAVGPQGKVYAVDVEPEMVSHIAKRAERERTANVVAVLGLPDDPRLPDAGVDVIFICDTWHHIDDRLNYIRRLGRALKPGGRVAVVDFHERPLPVGPPPEHKLPRQAVVDEFAEAGWILAEESDRLPYQYALIFSPPAAGT